MPKSPSLTQNGGESPQRGEVNVFYTGLPPYHQYAIEQGWDPIMVDNGVREETIQMLEAGYNVYVVWAGPEIPMEVLAEKMRSIGVEWHITGIGVGVRATTLNPVLHYLEDLIHLFRKETPNAQQVFNNGPSSCLWSLQERIPLAPDPANRPGKLYGYEVLFDGKPAQPLQWPASKEDKK